MNAAPVPRCARCGRLHLADLQCWRSSYAERVTASVLATQGTVCWLCGRDGSNSADHVKPRSEGGTDDPSNLRPAHQAPCNASRGARDPFPPDPDPRPEGVGLSTRWRMPA